MLKLLNIELKKQFKNPLMIIIVITLIMLMISLAFVFNPINVNNKENVNTNLTAQEAYENYYNESFKIYENLENVQNILSYYNNLKQRQDDILKLDQDIKIAYNNLKLILNQGNSQEINDKCNFIYQNLEEYCYLLTNFDNIHNIKYIETIMGNNLYINNSYFSRIRELTAEIESYIISNNSTYGYDAYTLLTSSNYETILNEVSNIAINFINFTIKNIYSEILNSYNNYQEYLKSTTPIYFSSTKANTYLSTLISNFNEFKEIYNDLQLSSNIVLCKESVITNTNNLINKSDNIFELIASSRQGHQEIISRLSEINFISNLKSFSEDYTIIMLDYEIVEELNTYVDYAFNNFEENEKIIFEAYQQNNSLKLQENILKQKNLVVSINQIINNSIILKCYENYNVYEKYIDENEIYTYKCETILAKYYITNNTYSAKVLQNYQCNYQVNETISCYDYIVFAMQISTFIILLYMIFIICNTISGEHSKGTLSITLMSPHKRSTIFNAKIVSVILVMLILQIVSLIASSITGIIIFGEEFGTIISIFNAESIIMISPIIAILINLLSNIALCLGFILIIFMITSLIKSFFVSFIISSVVVILSIVLSKIKWSILYLLPTNNFNFAKYFNAYFYTSDNLINIICDSITYSSQNFYLSLVIYCITIIILYISSVSIFKRKSY